MALIPIKTVVLSVGSININQRIVENLSVEDKNNYSTYKTHDNTLTRKSAFLNKLKVMPRRLWLRILMEKMIVQTSALVRKWKVMLRRL